MDSRLLLGNRADSVVFREMESQEEEQAHGGADTLSMEWVGFEGPLGYNRQCAR